MFLHRSSSQNARLQHVLLVPLVLLFFGSFCSGTTTESQFIIRNWDIEEGLPASDVSVLAKTPDGCLWIGTPAGLVRYDGARFTTFCPDNTPALSDARVGALLVDHTGALWIGTADGGLARMAANSFEPVSLGGAVPKGELGSFVEDRSGTLWGIVAQHGVFSWHKGKAGFYGANSGLPSAALWGLAVDGQGGVWANDQGRLMQFRRGRWQAAEGLPPGFPRIYAACPCRDGGLWLACAGKAGPPIGDRGAQLFKYRDNRVIEAGALPCDQDSSKSLPRRVMEGNEGGVWCAERGAGIFLWRGGRWQSLCEPPFRSEIQAKCLIADEDSVLWIGMDGAGLYQARERAIEALEAPAGTPAASFSSVCSSRDGAIWGGTDGNGIYRWKDGVAVHFGSQAGLTNGQVNAILQDRASNIWAGTMRGLFRLDGARFEPVTGADGLRSPVFALKEDQDGSIWAGTGNGLVQIGRDSTNEYGREQGIPMGIVNAIEEDSRGKIWVLVSPCLDVMAPGVAGRYGLFVRSGKRFERVQADQWAGESRARSLCADADGNLWIGTIGCGIYRVSEGGITQYSLDDGVPQNRILTIMADDARNLWFCSESGVFGCPIEQLESYTRGCGARLSWWQVQRSDGLPGRLPSGNGQSAAARGGDGRLWLADGNAIAAFDPRAVRQAARLRSPIIQEVTVNGEPHLMSGNNRLRITTDARRVEISYTAPNTTTLGLPTFWTRLRGLDPAWVRGGITRVANYNLQPGDYEFAVAVTGPDGSRIESSTPLAIEVEPQIWERSAVRVLAGLLLAAGVALGVRRWELGRTKRRVQRLEIQRAMDQVRQRIARDIHDDLGAGLTEITLLSDNVTGNGSDTQAMKRTVRRIADCARALTHEMDEAVWAINPQTDTFDGLATYLNDFAQERLALAGIRCRLNTATELPKLDISTDIRHSLYRAAKEALNNAIKYSEATEVEVTFECRGKYLFLRIQDNGRGFDPRQQFRHCNGLKNMRQRLEEVGGRCDISSKIGAGTTVCFTIPGMAGRALQPSTHAHPIPS